MLLNREGWKVGKYLAERLYREEGLTLHQRRKRHRRVAEHRRALQWLVYAVVKTGTDYRRFPEATMPGGRIPSLRNVEATSTS